MPLRPASLLLPLLFSAIFGACKEEPELPDCDAPRHVMRDDLKLDLDVDLRDPDAPRVRERISVRADADGRSLTLFGRDHKLLRADGGVRYDGETATFCTKPYRKGDTVTVELETKVPPAAYSSLCGGYDRFVTQHDGGTEREAYGTFSEPYCASQWLFVPQAAPEVSTRFDGSPVLTHVALRVTAPSSEWTVLGPSGRGRRKGAVTTFEQGEGFPLYALALAASSDFEVRTLGKTGGGVEVLLASVRGDESLSELWPVVRGTFDFMERELGPHRFGQELVLTTMPNFLGGMEHVGAPWIGVRPGLSAERIREVLVHELVHQWWGNSVRFADFHDLWLAEAFADWFTLYRIMPMLVDEVQSADAISGHRRLASFSTRPLRPADDAKPEELKQAFTRAYGYGGTFLEMIAVRLARDFDRDALQVLRTWYLQSQGKAVSTRDFEKFLATEVGQPEMWRALFETWAYATTPTPAIVASDYAYAGGEVSFSLSMGEGATDLSRLRLAVFVDDRPQLLDVPLTPSARKLDVRAKLSAAPTRLQIDPDHFYVTKTTPEEKWSGPELSY